MAASPKTKDPAKPRCPKCGKSVIKGGVGTTRNGKDGVQRWLHSHRDRKHCKWHGRRPVGLETVESTGVDRKVAATLHSLVKTTCKARYVITAAQNATPVNKRFLASLLSYCAKRKAQLIVIPYRYKNPTSMWSDKAEDDDWWASEITPHLLDLRVDLNPNLILLADIKTQPTASTPLAGFEAMTGAKSAIIGHPKLELVTVPTPQSKMAKILTSTGAVTVKNYIPSKAGKKGEHHHTFGACLAEINGKIFHLRQLNAVKDGSFIDLDTEYRPDGTTSTISAELVMGDTHVDFADPGVTKATFGPKGIVETLKCSKLVWHDVLDFVSGSHHHRADPFIMYAKFHSAVDDVEAELDRCYAFIDRHTPKAARNIIVASNHHEHLARWVRETDPRTNPRNAVFWARTFEAMCLGSEMKDVGPSTIDPFAWWARRKLKSIKRTTFLNRNQSCLINGIEVGFHGDQGANGSRGNIKGYSRIGVKTITGHTHTPGIKDGAYQVGGGTRLGLTYLRGPSSWLHAHCAIYPNGKRSLIFIVDGEWRA